MLAALLALVLGSDARAQAPGAAPAGAAAANASKPAPPPPANPVSLTADGLGAKAHLEDLLARRYAQELSTLLDRDAFTMSAQLDLVVAPPPVDPPEKDDGLPLDLRLGTIDPDDLIRKYADPEMAAKIGSFLSNFRIKKATVAVGLGKGTSPEDKALVEGWLSPRVVQEFGVAGVGSVSFVQQRRLAFFDRLNEFQGLAGQGLIALAILIGAIAWMLARPSSKVAEAAVPAPVAAATPPVAIPVTDGDTADAEGKMPEANTKAMFDESEALRTRREVESYSSKLGDLVRAMDKEKEAVVRAWCEDGEQGRLKLAVFAEAVAKVTGRLPIPADAAKEMGKVFAKMPEMALAEKRDLLGKAYWDMMAALSLGAETLSRPFGYLANMEEQMISQALVEQNERMKTFVSIHMPMGLRQSYLRSVDADAKKALLQEAANLGSLSTQQYQDLDSEFKSKLAGGDRESSVAFDAALTRLAEALSPLEELTLMGTITGDGVERYKRSQPSLAFLHEWPDDRMAAVFSTAMPNEVVAYLRQRGDHAQRVLSVCPPMTAAVAQDDLQRPDTGSDDDTNRLLSSLLERMQALVSQGEINLARIFDQASIESTEAVEAFDAGEATEVADVTEATEATQTPTGDGAGDGDQNAA
jgi:hypothetical protein